MFLPISCRDKVDESTFDFELLVGLETRFFCVGEDDDETWTVVSPSELETEMLFLTNK
jgi:hypothetical protein